MAHKKKEETKMADIAWIMVIPEEISKKLFEDEGIDFVEIFIKDPNNPEFIGHYFESHHLDPKRSLSSGFETIGKRKEGQLYEACLKVKTEIGREKATKVYNKYGWWLSVTCSSRPEDDLPDDIESRLDSAVEWGFR